MITIFASIFIVAICLLYVSLCWSVFADAIRDVAYGNFFDAFVGFCFTAVLVSLPCLLIASSLVSN